MPRTSARSKGAAVRTERPGRPGLFHLGLCGSEARIRAAKESWRRALAPRENNDLRSLALIWAEAAARAQDVGELVELSNRYFETWAGREVGYLPGHCRPHEVAGLEALLAYAVEVYRCYQAKPADHEIAEILEALLIFTEAVSARASYLRARGN